MESDRSNVLIEEYALSSNNTTASYPAIIRLDPSIVVGLAV